MTRNSNTVELYVLLPGMKDPSVALLKRAIKEIDEYYSPRQALGSIHDIEVLGKLEYEALRSPNEQDVHKWLGKYLTQNEMEGKIESDEE